MVLLAGIFICYFVEVFCNKLFGSHSHSHDGKAHDHKHATKSGAIVSLVGDFSHNITDGLLISITYMQGLNFGFAATLAIFIHEIPHEVGDFAIGFKSGFGYFKIISFQIFTAMGAFLGTYIGLKFGEAFMTEGVLLAAGAFIYLALCTFLQELRTKTSIAGCLFNLIAAFFGLLFMYCVAALE